MSVLGCGSHAFSEFALQLRQSLEDNFLTTWMDLMDPTGIGGGAVWRDEIASGIKHAAVVLCVLSETYPVSQWCMKELAFAKAHNVPGIIKNAIIIMLTISIVLVGVLGETTDMTDELQVYLWSRQLVDFRQAITSTEPALVVNHDVYNTQLTALLDGLRNEVEKRRLVDRRDVLLSPLTVSVRQTEVEFAYHQRYVFICHGGCHTDFAKRLQGMLKLHGIASYADHQVGGTTHDAILNCSAFLPIFSDKSCRTDAFSDLFAFAENKEKPIVPIVLSANFFPLAHLQWFEAPFSIDDISYPTAEHFMMAEKARLFHDNDTLADILGATDPATAKAYGRSVDNFDEGVWCRHRFDIVVRANTAKFGQNEALKAYLLGTKKHILVEASPRDPIWGIGLSSKNEHAQNPKHWRGLNLLGFALMTVRELLQADECT
ncbi:hypothetical protein AaE_003952 [Aphanomyces astaci]|uniref:TIR domain-containing protein n=1 Tax=Aphanomyces astaci TaxID=112090 RepID=A0A6A5A604_APHAT|nr:hypothetical protein AaE_003952 [Aphanomyces astaci]